MTASKPGTHLTKREEEINENIWGQVLHGWKLIKFRSQPYIYSHKIYMTIDPDHLLTWQSCSSSEFRSCVLEIQTTGRNAEKGNSLKENQSFGYLKGRCDLPFVIAEDALRVTQPPVQVNH